LLRNIIRSILIPVNKKGVAMKYSELKKLLKENGCYKQSEGTKHENWFSPVTNKTFLVGRHNTEDVKNGTLTRILKSAGLK
jgi:predicted RNA binding protein YcfA (HicA-like mRNA interferase family)